MTTEEDKRRTPRVSVGFKVKVDTTRGTFNGMGRDLSEGGIGVYVKKLAPIGSPVEVFFSLPGAESPVEVTGEVMYHRRGGPGLHDDWMGIKFLRMDAASQKSIRTFVKSQANTPRIPPPLPGK
jgi:uncharacterized protein (TIGR02266 family)